METFQKGKILLYKKRNIVSNSKLKRVQIGFYIQENRFFNPNSTTSLSVGG
ncbi:hypothetical protein [Leptospira santarosai]|uniref:hypothetical protein n=1 Tax=Leptospira santarosai TaxID=28183 RepID=UPI00031C355C|nr:hypothetical protein [Leptospira santarosai]MDI7213662.1 hypothetical protein [Leptospira santarosai]MDI7221579.1 hypothetical protein [Leptospira santarosai]